jgi:hypothetical protein
VSSNAPSDTIIAMLPADVRVFSERLPDASVDGKERANRREQVSQGSSNRQTQTAPSGVPFDEWVVFTTTAESSERQYRQTRVESNASTVVRTHAALLSAVERLEE